MNGDVQACNVIRGGGGLILLSLSLSLSGKVQKEDRLASPLLASVLPLIPSRPVVSFPRVLRKSAGTDEGAL